MRITLSTSLVMSQHECLCLNIMTIWVDDSIGRDAI